MDMTLVYKVLIDAVLIGTLLPFVKKWLEKASNNGEKVIEQRFEGTEEKLNDLKAEVRQGQAHTSDQLGKFMGEFHEMKLRVAIMQTELKTFGVRMDTLNEGFNRLVEVKVKGPDYGKVTKK